MPATHRLGDICTGHGCYPPRPSVQGSSNVFVNGIPQVRQGDMYAVHCCKYCHSGSAAVGSPTVYVNGKQKHRIGDAVSCGSKAMTGSSNVFVGDG